MSDQDHQSRRGASPNAAWALIDKLREGIVQLDINGHITLINQAACDMLSVDSQTILGQAWEAACDHCMSNGRSYPAGHSPIRQALVDNNERQVEGDRFVNSDGVSRVVSYDCLPVDSDRPSGLVISFVDITSQLLTEQLHTWEASILTLMSGGARLGALIEAILGGLDVLTPGGQSVVEIVNKETGERQQLCVSSQNTLELDKLSIDGAESGLNAAQGEWPILDNAGRLWARLCFFGGGLVDNNRPEKRALDKAVSLIRLALEQDQIHQIREDSDRQFQQLAEQVSDVFWVTEASGALAYVSPAFERLWGVPVASLYQQPWLWLDFILEEDRSRVVNARSLQSGGRYRIEYRIRQPEGRIRWIEDQAFPVKDETGKVVRIVGTARDITARKATEQRINDLMLDLRRSNQELQSFASIVSHDLQEPLRKVQMFSERLQQDTRNLDERQVHFLDRMQKAAIRMRTLIQSLLSYARLSALEESKQPVDLNEILDDVLDDLELRLTEAGVTLDRRELPVIQGYGNQWRQLLMNLVGNAIKFRRPEVALQLAIYCQTDSQDRLQLVVEDNGMGFDPERHPNVFKPLYRIAQAEGVDGTGMGLAIVEKVVHQHGLTIRVESSPGQGSRFIIQWPSTNPMFMEGQPTETLL